MQANLKIVDTGLLVSREHPEALIEPEKILRAYFNSPNIGLCILDPELHYLAINRSLADMDGVPVEAHLGKTVREVLGGPAELLEDKFRQVLHAKTPLNFELSGVLPSRTENTHWIVHYLPICDGDDNVNRVGAIVLDITAQKQLELSLQEVGGQLRQETGRLRIGMSRKSSRKSRRASAGYYVRSSPALPSTILVVGC